MRVTAGMAKGHKLYAPKGYETRPTADKIKQSIFNIINEDLIEASFLDLFAGTGQIGIEALSRGAKTCVFVDSKSSDFIKKNVAKTNFSQQGQIIALECYNALRLLAKDKITFNIIFMDPPYNMVREINALSAEIKRLQLLKEGGYIIGEHDAKIDIKEFNQIDVFKQKIYGKTTAVSFFVPL